jgi:hypothetical protein
MHRKIPFMKLIALSLLLVTGAVQAQINTPRVPSQPAAAAAAGASNGISADACQRSAEIYGFTQASMRLATSRVEAVRSRGQAVPQKLVNDFQVASNRHTTVAEHLQACQQAGINARPTSLAGPRQ